MGCTYSELATIKCKQCSRDFPAEVMLIIDESDQPDRLIPFQTAGFQELTCPSCQLIGKLDTPILIYRPQRIPALIISPAQHTDRFVDSEQIDALVAVFQLVANPARSPKWIKQNSEIVPREALPLALNDRPREAPRIFFKQAAHLLRLRPVLFHSYTGSGQVLGMPSIPHVFRQTYSAIRHNQDLFYRNGDKMALQLALDGWRAIVSHPVFSEQSPRFKMMAFNQTGIIYRQAYQLFSSDLTLLESARRFWEKALQLDPLYQTDRAKLLTNLGSVYLDIYGRTDQVPLLEIALSHLQQALLLTRPDDMERLLLLNNIGIGYRRRYLLTNNENDLLRAFEAVGGSVKQTAHGDPYRASRLLNLSSVEYDLYVFISTAAEVDRSVAILQEYLQFDTTKIYNDLSETERPIFLQSLRLALAQQLLSGARAAAELVLSRAWECTRYLHNWALALYLIYESSKDETVFLEASNLSREVCQNGLLVDPECILANSLVWGEAHMARREWHLAIEAFGYGREAIALLLEAQLSRTNKAIWLTAAQRLVSLTGYALARADRLSDSIVALDQGRARLLVEALERNRVDLAKLPELGQSELYGRYQAVVRQLADLEQENLVETSVLALNSDDRWDDLRAARLQLASLITAVRQVPGYTDFFRLSDFTELQAVLTSDSQVGVYLLTTAHGGLALIVQSDMIAPVWLEVTDTKVNEMLFPDRGKRSTGNTLYSQQEKIFLQPALDRLQLWLGEHLVAPIAQILRAQGNTAVTLIPMGRLGLLPLHAAQYNWNDQLHTFLDEFTISYSPSAQVLSHGQTSIQNSPRNARALLGVGNPTPLAGKDQSLDFSQSEIEIISGLFETHSLLLNQAATRAALERELSYVNYLHFACHGEFHADHPIESGLILSADEYLKVRDLMNVQPFKHIRLAILSACRTAITDFNRLPEEMIGLPAAFLQAGLPGVVGTLWSVGDFSTMLLMIRFYEYHLIDGLHPAAALRKAQLWLRDVTNAELSELFAKYKLTATDRPASTRMAYEMVSEKFREHTLRDPNEKRYAHPYYWAPFVFYGV